jgi:hypothetical protein
MSDEAGTLSKPLEIYISRKEALVIGLAETLIIVAAIVVAVLSPARRS